MTNGRPEGQEQSQQVRAEIHTHNHYYLIQQQDGSIQVSEKSLSSRLHIFSPKELKL